MSLRSTNLNLLPILRELLKQGSITRAAAQLGLSQPATSNALARLREVLGDPLLVQTGRTMRLTPRAEQLRPMVDIACGSIETLLLGQDFVPGQVQRDFTVATPDYMALLLGPTLLHTLANSAPGIRIRFADVGLDFRRLLASGDLDIAIIVRADDVVQGLNFQAGYMDRLVGVVAADHPLAISPPKTIGALNAYPRLGIDPALQGVRVPRQLAETLTGFNSPLLVSASHMLALPFLAAQTQGVAFIPETLARHAAQSVRLAQFEPPGSASLLDLCLVWSPALDAEPGHRWLRATLDMAMRVHFKARGFAP